MSQAPQIPEGTTVLMDAPGPVIDGPFGKTTYEAFHHAIVREGSTTTLYTTSGLGQEEMRLSAGTTKAIVAAWAALPPESAFLALHTIWDQARKARNAGYADAKAEYVTAYAEGRLKKRKVRNQPTCRVWIERGAEA